MLDVAIYQSIAESPQVAPVAWAGHRMSFGSVVPALGPRQYLPAPGTIYRATIGDRICTRRRPPA